MNRKTHITGDEIENRRPSGNSLKENYLHHDIGHAYVVSVLASHGFTVEEWGIDMRHDDGEDGAIYDDKMDLKIYEGERLAGLIDVKTKTKPKWMGAFNKRHYDKYDAHADEFDVPALIVMSLVNSDAVIDTFVTNIGELDPLTSDEEDWLYAFPDGNAKCVIPHEYRNDMTYLLSELQ